MQRPSRIVCVALALTGGVIAATAAPVSADKPLLFEEGEFEDTFVIPGGVGLCDFPVQNSNRGTFRTTVYFDRDGETRLARSHVNGTSDWSLPGGDVVVSENWVVNVSFELAPGSGPGTPPLSETVVGNPWNAHAGAGGVLVNDSGRVVFDGDGNIVSVSGPHEALFGEFEAFCDALAASADD